MVLILLDKPPLFINLVSIRNTTVSSRSFGELGFEAIKYSTRCKMYFVFGQVFPQIRCVAMVSFRILHYTLGFEKCKLALE